MPELPEVETIRLQLEPRLTDRRIIDAGSYDSHKFTMATNAIDHKVTEIHRRGKYLIISLTDETRAHRELIIHLGMTGRLSISRKIDPAHPHLRAWWVLDDSSVLSFHDVRRFGRVYVVKAGHYKNIATLSHLGPEPFSEQFTADMLWKSIRSSRRRIKTQLLSQRPVAGLGNIYADEALWLARINPVSRRLSKDRSITLVSAIREVLTSALNHNGTTLRDYATITGHPGDNQYYLYCYGRFGELCLRCGTQLRRRVVDARSTTWCPVCQRY